MTVTDEIWQPRYGRSVSGPKIPLIILTCLSISWLLLYLPVYAEFAGYAWRQPENSHTPFIFAIVIASGYLSFERYIARVRRTRLGVSIRARLIGAALLFIAALIFPFARNAGVDLVLSALQPVFALGAVLFILGFAGARAFWFAIAMSLYLIVWPGWLLDALTLPLKVGLSRAVADVLYTAGLPISHSGAVIHAGAYQLLVANACAGLNSLVALTAVGAVYLKIANRPSLAANLFVIASLVPIAIMANAIRVMLLVLITYYLGYDAGQGFLHESAGLFMFIVALGLVFLIDGLAGKIFSAAPRFTVPVPPKSPEVAQVPRDTGGRARATLFVAVALVVTAGASTALERTTGRSTAYRISDFADAPALEEMIPERFGDWQQVSLASAILPEAATLEAGEAVAYRAYRDDLGRVVTVVIAYGPPYSDNVRVHRPETCYVAHGFIVTGRQTSTIATGAYTIDTVQLKTQRADIREAVTYWLRDGKSFTTSARQGQWRSLLDRRNAGDSALVRVSSRHGIVPDFALHAAFLEALANSLTEDGRAILLGDRIIAEETRS